jgi:hypothetical protein
LEPEYIKFSTENIIQLSFGALLRGEITAIICFALAVLLEIVDTIIVYMIRGTKKREEKEEKEDNVVPPNISVDNNKKIVNVR